MGRTKSLSVIAFSASAVILCAVALPKVLDKSDEPVRVNDGAAAQDVRNVVSSADPGTQSQDLMFVPLERCALTPLAATPDLDEYYPATDPSGTTIAYVRGKTDLSTRDLVLHDTETSKERVLRSSDQLIGDLSWSPDGTKIAFWQATDSGKTTIDVVDVADARWKWCPTRRWSTRGRAGPRTAATSPG